MGKSTYINNAVKLLTDEIITTFREDTNAWLEHFNDKNVVVNGSSGKEFNSPYSQMEVAYALRKFPELQCKDPSLNHIWITSKTAISKGLFKKKEVFEKEKHYAHSESPCYAVWYRLRDDETQKPQRYVIIHNGKERNFFYTNEIEKIRSILAKDPNVDITSFHTDYLFSQALPIYHASQLDEEKIKELHAKGELKLEDLFIGKVYENEKNNSKKIPDIDKIVLKGEDKLPIGKVYIIKELGKGMYANKFKLDTHTNPQYTMEIKAYLDTLNEKNKYQEVNEVLSRAKSYCYHLIELDKTKKSIKHRDMEERVFVKE